MQQFKLNNLVELRCVSCFKVSYFLSIHSSRVSIARSSTVLVVTNGLYFENVRTHYGFHNVIKVKNHLMYFKLNNLVVLRCVSYIFSVHTLFQSFNSQKLYSACLVTNGLYFENVRTHYGFHNVIKVKNHLMYQFKLNNLVELQCVSCFLKFHIFCPYTLLEFQQPEALRCLFSNEWTLF